MIDPFCYSPQLNAETINAAYDYFRKPRRKKLLNKIVNGMTIEILVSQLFKGRDLTGQDYPICFRLAPITFEGVKSAYDHGEGVDPGLVVVQIYVKGDAFALTDEYYRDGISW